MKEVGGESRVLTQDKHHFVRVEPTIPLAGVYSTQRSPEVHQRRVGPGESVNKNRTPNTQSH